MALQWVAADLSTGQVIADLPSVVPSWPLRRTISNYDTGQVTLHLDGAPENWQRAVKAGASVLACYDDRIYPDGTQPNPIQWAGYVTNTDPQVTDDTVVVYLTTLEGYLNRRYVRDVTYTAGWQSIVASLIGSYVTGGTLPGITLLLDHPDAGTVPTNPLVWQNTDNATVLTRINQLIGEFGGEFTINWAWSTDGRSIVPTLQFGPRIGQATVAGLGPAVTFDLPGCVTAASQPSSYADGDGANVITYYSSGQGDVTPYAADAVVADFDDRPAFEFRDSPVPSVTDTTRLHAFAVQALKVLSHGATPLSLTVTRENDFGRTYGIDWRMGDDIGYSIGGLDDQGNDTVLAFPGGIRGGGRVIAVELTDESSLTPILFQTAIYREYTG